MSQLQERFNKILSEIEERIKDEEELNFIKQKIADISIMYIDELDKIMEISQKRVNQVYENQKIIEKKMSEIESGMNTIEKELFVEDEYDFEIVCPYCNYEFLTELNSDKKEVECPECHNTIELDWNQDKCGGGCNSCGACESTHEAENDDEEQDSSDDDM